MSKEISCPGCGSKDVLYSQKRDEYICEDCDQRFHGKKQADGRPIFISYAHKDAGDFTRRLCKDLGQRGYKVWWAEPQIRASQSWDERIEQGIRDCSLLLAVLTPHATRRGSICRDEWRYAMVLHRPVVPAKFHPDARPVLQLVRRRWIDFTGPYEEGLQQLIDFLTDGDESGLVPPLAAAVGVEPIDFGWLLSRLTRDFAGRGWVNKEIDDWILSSRKPGFLIVAKPGVGKSAFAASLEESRGDEVGAIHLCTTEDEDTLDPHRFVASVAGQLHTRLPEYATALGGVNPAKPRTSGKQAFLEIIVKPMQALERRDTVLLVVDSLDEAARAGGETILDVLVAHVGNLPSWARLLTTTRPDQRVLTRLADFKHFELAADSKDNRNDIDLYVDRRLSEPALKELWQREKGERAPVVKAIRRASEGNFLVARCLLTALEEGDIGLGDLSEISPGLQAFYHSFFVRQFPDIATYDKQYYPLLAALSVARAPLPMEILEQIPCSSDRPTFRRVEDLGQLLDRQESGYTLFHTSLREWLHEHSLAGDYFVSESRGECLLADAGWEQYRCGVEEMTQYMLAHLPEHLGRCRRREQLGRLLTDLSYLQTRVEAGQIYDVVTELSRALEALPAARPQRHILELLHEAIRRDVHFIARHPETLFQCLWNTCWWYDCPEAADHYQLPAQGWNSAPPWDRKGPKLFELMKRWREAREAAGSGGLWMRSLRPPGTHLGTAQKAVLRGHNSSVPSVSFSPDGEQIVSGSWDKTVRRWEARTGAPLGEDGEAPWAHEDLVNCVAISPNGRWVVSGSKDKTVRVWDLQGREEPIWLSSHEVGVRSVDWSPDGGMIASGAENGTVRVWDSRSGEELHRLRGHDDAVTGVAWNPGGSGVATASADGAAGIWHGDNGSEIRRLCGHEDQVSCVAWSPDGSAVATGSFDTTIRIWDAQTWEERLCIEGHENKIRCLCYSPEGRRIASGAGANTLERGNRPDDHTIRIWDAESGRHLRCLRGHDRRVMGLAFCPDGDRIVSGSRDSSIRIWSTEDGEERRPLRWDEGWITSVASVPGGRRVITGARDETLRTWDPTNGRQVDCLDGLNSQVWGTICSPDGGQIACALENGRVEIWSADTSERLMDLPGHKEAVECVAYSRDGRRLISGSCDRTGRIWETETGTESTCLRGHQAAVTAVAFSPDGTRALTGSRDETAAEWDARTGERIACLHGHEDVVRRVAYFADGTGILTESDDGMLRVWEANINGTDDPTTYSNPSELASWLRRLGFLELAYGQESAIPTPVRRQPKVWCPGELYCLTRLANGRTWAGTSGTHFSLMVLEGLEQSEK